MWIIFNREERFRTRKGQFSPSILDAHAFSDEEACQILIDESGCAAIKIDDFQPQMSVRLDSPKLKPEIEVVMATALEAREIPKPKPVRAMAQAGQASLLMLLISMMVSLILLAASVPPILAARRAENQASAKVYAAKILNIQTMLGLCADSFSNPCSNTAYLANQLPAAGTWQANGYTLTYNSTLTNGIPWSLSVVPASALYGGPDSFYVSAQDGFLHCSSAGGPVDSSYPPC